MAAPVIAQQAQQPQRISHETLDRAEKVFGIDFGKAEDEAALRGVRYEPGHLRATEGPGHSARHRASDHVPPLLPGKQPKPGATPGAKLKLSTTPPAGRRGSVEDLAFLPVTALAGLIARREVTSTDLTKMYLARLEEAGAALNCVVTLTEELALEQAAAAGREIKAGRYRGPLHGIPWGAKDLFATKGIPHDLRRGTVSEASHRLRRHDRRAAPGRGRGTVAKLSMGFSPRAISGSADGLVTRGTGAERDRAAPRQGPGRPPRPAWRASRLARETRGSIISPSRGTAWSDCVQPTAASAATARWRSAGRWTRSARCAGR